MADKTALATTSSDDSDTVDSSAIIDGDPATAATVDAGTWPANGGASLRHMFKVIFPRKYRCVFHVATCHFPCF